MSFELLDYVRLGLSAVFTADPVAIVFIDPEVIYTRADSPHKGLADAMAFAKSNPSKARWGASNPASLERLAMERLSRVAGVKVPIVSHEGGGDQMIGVLNGTYDIGMATLSAAAGRNENILYICYDNEIYGNTGGQRSSATPPGARTTTTPSGKQEAKKDIVGILAAHGIPYAATLSIAHPEDVRRKLLHAFKTPGMKFLLIHSPCPTGWKSEPGDSIQLVRLAVQSGLFPLYEVFDGARYRINIEPDWTDPSAYFAKQRRFRKDQIDLETTKRVCRERYERLKVMAEAFPA